MPTGCVRRMRAVFHNGRVAVVAVVLSMSLNIGRPRQKSVRGSLNLCERRTTSFSHSTLWFQVLFGNIESGQNRAHVRNVEREDRDTSGVTNGRQER